MLYNSFIYVNTQTLVILLSIYFLAEDHSTMVVWLYNILNSGQPNLLSMIYGLLDTAACFNILSCKITIKL